jgi:hypothetical protein
VISSPYFYEREQEIDAFLCGFSVKIKGARDKEIIVAEVFIPIVLTKQVTLTRNL